ncbi:hypothetical protein [Nonomuraea sp. NPDC049684]|uniref:hypothetical protein n=1 Tax=unclassified Nonomuraea TaxID=2593643 RepID=UPI00379C9FA5
MCRASPTRRSDARQAADAEDRARVDEVTRQRRHGEADEPDEFICAERQGLAAQARAAADGAQADASMDAFNAMA